MHTKFRHLFGLSIQNGPTFREMLFANPQDIDRFMNHAQFNDTIRGNTLKGGETEIY